MQRTGLRGVTLYKTQLRDLLKHFGPHIAWTSSCLVSLSMRRKKLAGSANEIVREADCQALLTCAEATLGSVHSADKWNLLSQKPLTRSCWLNSIASCSFMMSLRGSGKQRGHIQQRFHPQEGQCILTKPSTAYNEILVLARTSVGLRRRTRLNS